MRNEVSPGIRATSLSQEQGNRSHSEFLLNYAKAWQKVGAQWKEETSSTRGWLTYSANYLFKSQTCNWAVDPLMPYTLLKSPYPAEIPDPLRQLEVILLTHKHKDHWDEHLFRQLADRPRVWLTPAFLLEPLRGAGVDAKDIVTVAPGETWKGVGLKATAYKGLHSEEGKRVDSFSWAVEMAGRQWMFFGDVRHYDASHYAGLGKIDVSFAHVWLGREKALEPSPPLEGAFCRFHEHFKPRRIVLAHLEERSRRLCDLWTRHHATHLGNRLAKTMEVTTPELLECIDFG